MDAQEAHAQFAHAQQLLEVQQLGEAKQVLKRILKKHPRYTNALFLIGQIARAEGRWDEAIDALQKLHAMAPDEPMFREHLATVLMLSNQGRFVPLAIEHFARALAQLPQASALAANLQTLALRADMPQAVIAAIGPFLAQQAVEGSERQRLSAGLAIAHFLRQDTEQSAAYARQTLALRQYAYDAQNQPLPGDYPFYHIYAQFILDLIAVRERMPQLYAGEARERMHAIGESHSLAPSELVVAGKRVASHLMMGCKAYMFTVAQGESWQFQFRRILQALPKDETAVAMFGEIDCRPGEGIMRQWASQPGYAMETEVASLVEAYVKFVKLSQLKRLAPTYIYGVPAPHLQAKADILPGKTPEDFVQLIRHFNACLAQQAQRQALPFIDVYASTAGHDGWAKEGVHIDHVHLQPSLVGEIFAAALR